MYSQLQPFLGNLLDTLRTSLNHQADVTGQVGPPEMHGDAGDSGVHHKVPSHGGSMGKEERVLLEGLRQQVSCPLPCQGLVGGGEAAMLVESKGCKAAGVLLLVPVLAS